MTAGAVLTLPLAAGCESHGSCASCYRTAADRERERQAAARIPSERQRLYETTATQFDRAVFYKPDEASLERAPFGLEPLIMQEIHPELPPSGIDPILGDGGDEPVLYAASSQVSLMGQTYPQVSYWWRHGSAVGAAPSWRGIRMTVGSSGFPVISEILHPPGTPNPSERMIFVASAIDSGAQAAYGGPLPGRRFAVEGAVGAATPDVVVARVLSDGPQPMGPYVYLDRHLQITTLLCRCMPSQVQDVPENRLYRIEPVESLPADVVASLSEHQPDPAALERVLRLPAGF